MSQSYWTAGEDLLTGKWLTTPSPSAEHDCPERGSSGGYSERLQAGPTTEAQPCAICLIGAKPLSGGSRGDGVPQQPWWRQMFFFLGKGVTRRPADMWPGSF